MTEKNRELDRKWQKLRVRLKAIFNKKPKDLQGVLYLIGLQELGKGNKEFTKEEKQDLLHIAICKVMSFSGYYVFEGRDEDGWPHWKNVKRLPHSDLLGQEELLKEHVVTYFEKEIGWK